MAGVLKKMGVGSTNGFLLIVPRCLASSARPSSSLVLSSTTNQVTTITMNNPKKYNAWDMSQALYFFGLFIVIVVTWLVVEERTKDEEGLADEARHLGTIKRNPLVLPTPIFLRTPAI